MATLGAPLMPHLVAWVGGRVVAASLRGRRTGGLGNTHLTVGKQCLTPQKLGALALSRLAQNGDRFT